MATTYDDDQRPSPTDAVREYDAPADLLDTIADGLAEGNAPGPVEAADYLAQQAAADVLDCGHLPTDAGPHVTGYAEDRATGRRFCYPCADDRERAELAEAEHWTAYLSADGRTVTTWTGGTLGYVIFRSTRPNHTPTGGEYWTLTARIGGAWWYGRTQGPGMVSHLHKSKAAQS